MSRFVQLHLLTSYPPSNLNRDDLGRPKTAIMGGKIRLRISSQSLKRAWRTSDVFKKALSDHTGVRTKRKGWEVYRNLLKEGVNEIEANNCAKCIIEEFGKLKELRRTERTDLSDDEKLRKELETEQLVHFSRDESNAMNALIEKISKEEELKKKILEYFKNKNEKSGKKCSPPDCLDLLIKENKTVDIALFGRMLASKPKYNIEAAVQVAHAISVQTVSVEDDYFTAVDDLNMGESDSGAAHLGEVEFASGLFYLYICIDKELLLENLSNDRELVNKSLGALIECATIVSPKGKQNSFASRSRASFVRCEVGDQQPRSLSLAFLTPIDGQKNSGMLEDAIKKLEETAQEMDNAYGKCADNECTMNLLSGGKTLQEIIQCACAL